MKVLTVLHFGSVETNNPYNISAMSKMFSRSYEGDMRYVDQYLVENITEMPKWKPRKWWYDIECNTGDDNFTTVIAIIDSDLDTPVVFAWADERTNCPYRDYNNTTTLPDGETIVHEKYTMLYLYGSK